MNPIDLLAAQFQKTFDDKMLTKTERQELQIAIAKAGLDQRKRDILRSKVFKIAAASIGSQHMFALEWLEDASRLLVAKDIESPSGQPNTRVIFSPGMDCLNAITSAIQGATKTLDVCVFTISDDRITDALIARHRAGVKVRVLTDNEKLLDEGSDITRIDKAGIEVRVDRTEYHMHHKFMVADGRLALTGSYNWTRSAAAYNEENILVTDQASVVKRYGEEFEKMWEKMEAF